MDVGKIISYSFKYPFQNIKKLPILFALFILAAIIPIGVLLDNRYVTIFGAVLFFIFILVVPGYLFSMVNIGLNESSMFPSLNFTKNIYDTLRLLALRIVYMLVPALVFFIAFFALGSLGINMLGDLRLHSFIFSLIFAVLVVGITYVLFEVLLFFAKARLSYLDSLKEALKIHEVIRDIRRIGIVKIIAWLIFMLILMLAASLISSAVISIPYVGFLIYLCVVIPILESIGNYSLGLLYSNIAQTGDSLDKLEKEIEVLKYLN